MLTVSNDKKINNELHDIGLGMHFVAHPLNLRVIKPKYL